MSFRFSDPAAAVAPPPAAASTADLAGIDLAPLIAMLGERQAASATALAQASLDDPAAAPPPLLAPPHGAFNAAMAARVAGWADDARAGHRE